MSFKSIRLRTNYNSANTDIVDTFYNPVLSEAVSYDRIAGYFNSTSLAVAANGIWNFISNNGHMRLLCGAELSKEDTDSILNAEKNIDEILDNNFLNDLDNIDDDIKRNHVKLLGWMIANNVLDIKIGVKMCDGEVSGGILHSKIGILYDANDNFLTFSGSNNETASGWKHNIESFKVFYSWEDSVKYTKEDIDSFKEFWENKNPNLKVMDIPDASKKGLLKLAPKNQVELDNVIAEILNLGNDNKKLFKHQKDAIDAWFDNDKKGIFEMATGTGKTFTALNCLKKVLKEENNILTVIACPYATLVEQWADEITKLNIGNVYRLYGSVNPSWKADLKTLMFNIELDSVKNPIILTTHNTFSMEFFREQIIDCSNKVFLIADEMHHLGAETFSGGLIDKYSYRLGLSATPQKYMDEEATEFIVNYFGGIVYTFNIREALMTRNPITHETYLTPYDYYPEKVSLNSEEFEDYKELSKKISFQMAIKKDNDEKDSLKSLIAKRRAIVNNAEEKYGKLHEILQNMKNPDHLIIFCSDKQIPKVMQILDEENVVPKHRFTQNEDAKKSKKYNGISQREYLLKEFDKGKYKVLVAIRCLNEGVDVPSADKVILMSSTTNPIEYVQRRGRVLRRYPGKDKAYIYDLLVIPKTKDSVSQGIINNELNRLLDFIQTADNKGECTKILKKWEVF
jgi:superfamily II DNA or RNA helicase